MENKHKVPLHYVKVGTWCTLSMRISVTLYFIQDHVTWVPVTAAWCVLGLQMEKTAFRYGGLLDSRELTRGVPAA